MTTLSGFSLWLVVLAAGLGTFLIRLSFLLVFERIETVPPWVRWVLSFVPAAVLAALVAPDFVSLSGISTPRVLAGALAAVVAWYTESVLGTIVVGLVALVLFRTLL